MTDTEHWAHLKALVEAGSIVMYRDQRGECVASLIPKSTDCRVVHTIKPTPEEAVAELAGGLPS